MTSHFDQLSSNKTEADFEKARHPAGEFQFLFTIWPSLVLQASGKRQLSTWRYTYITSLYCATDFNFASLINCNLRKRSAMSMGANRVSFFYKQFTISKTKRHKKHIRLHKRRKRKKETKESGTSVRFEKDSHRFLFHCRAWERTFLFCTGPVFFISALGKARIWLETPS